ncbi:MAG: hypothetical protein G01um101466_1, partial [Parcubacteria group bacterium Gr01-1014_66]
MEIVAYEEKRQKELCVRIADVIRKGDVAVIPTDTVYGLIADATNKAAL